MKPPAPHTKAVFAYNLYSQRMRQKSRNFIESSAVARMKFATLPQFTLLYGKFPHPTNRQSGQEHLGRLRQAELADRQSIRGCST